MIAYAPAYIGALTQSVSGVPGNNGSAIWKASLKSKVCNHDAATPAPKNLER